MRRVAETVDLKLTRSQDEALRCLDWCCWDDAEAGGDGWCDIPRFARRFGVQYERAAQLLRSLLSMGLAESRRRRGSLRRRLHYALSERGAEYTHGDFYREQMGSER